MKTMKAILVSSFGGPDVLKYLTNLEIPKILDNQICVRMKYAGVNPADTYRRSGNYMVPQALPYVPGSDGAGVVHLCGSKVTKFKPGDRVYFCKSNTGSYAEYCMVSEDSTFLLHDRLTFQDGASIGVPYFTAYRALVTKGDAKAGQTVLVHGASGGVGLACCQIAKQLGLNVIGTAGTEEGLELVKQNGASFAFNHRKEGYISDIQKSCCNIDLIVEMLANVNLQKDLDIIADGGKILIVGSRDKVEIIPRSFIKMESTVMGVQLYKCTPDELKQIGEFFDRGQKDGWVKPVIAKEFKLEEASLAHEEVIKHESGSKGKILLAID